MAKCYWCVNEATRIDYRDSCGQTNKIHSCDECIDLETKFLRRRDMKITELTDLELEKIAEACERIEGQYDEEVSIAMTDFNNSTIFLDVFFDDEDGENDDHIKLDRKTFMSDDE